MDKGMEMLGPVGTFLFFFWFDYSAWGLAVWALHVQDIYPELFRSSKGTKKSNRNSTLRPKLSRSVVEWFNLFIVPIQFWTAPWMASSLLALDSRKLIVARQSPKITYAVAVIVLVVALKVVCCLRNVAIAAIVVSGIGCGCVHHLPLFVFGLRGYGDLFSLVVTLLTEWPALICGIAFVSHLGDKFVVDGITKKLSSSAFRVLMWAALFGQMWPHLSSINEKDAVAYLIPYLPGEYMQSVGTAYLRTRTCILPSILPAPLLAKSIDCWDSTRSNKTNDGTDMLVFASAAKSGAVLSARVVAEIGASCGLCVASGERSHAGIPGPVENLPTYEGRLLHAIVNMRDWPNYVERQGFLPSLPRKNARVRCVTTLRDPMARLRSLYLYARSGGENWFRYQRAIKFSTFEFSPSIMMELGSSERTVEESVAYFWNSFGKDYLDQSHEYTMENMKRGCEGIKMEDLRSDFDGRMTAILRTFGVKESAIPELIGRLASADLSRRTRRERDSDPHVTKNKFSESLVEAVGAGLRGIEEVRTAVERQRRELGYNS
eukprot:g3664.t1